MKLCFYSRPLTEGVVSSRWKAPVASCSCHPHWGGWQQKEHSASRESALSSLSCACTPQGNSQATRRDSHGGQSFGRRPVSGERGRGSDGGGGGGCKGSGGIIRRQCSGNIFRPRGKMQESCKYCGKLQLGRGCWLAGLETDRSPLGRESP